MKCGNCEHRNEEHESLSFYCLGKDKEGYRSCQCIDYEKQKMIEDFCESERPNRKTICQKSKGHKGSCRAVIFWETK